MKTFATVSALSLLFVAYVASAATPASAPAATLASTPAPVSASVSKMDTATVKDLCSTPDYQCVTQPVEVNLVGLDGKPFHRTLPAPLPIIQQGLITLYAGQSIRVQADVSFGKLTGLKLVSKVTYPEKTLVMSLKQVKLKSGRAMLFEIKNPFDWTLRYHASIVGLRGGESIMTSTCPVPANLQNTESWPEPVFMVALAGLELLPKGSKKEDLTCAY